MKQIKWDKEMVGLVCGCICLIGAIGWSQYQHVTTEERGLESSAILSEELDRQKEMDKHIVRVTDRMMQLEQSLWVLGEKLPQIKEHMIAKNVRLEARTVVVGNGSRLVAEYQDKTTTKRSSTFDVTIPSLVTAYEIDMVLAESPLAGLGRAFVEAESESKINAMFLLALAVHESNWGSSTLAREKNNLFGFGAYDSNPYYGAMVFASKEECVKHVAKFLREHYLEGGYYRGKTIQSINQSYASDRAWGEKVFATMTRLDAKIQNLGLSE